MSDHEAYGLRIPVSLAMFADLREMCSRQQELGTHNILCVIDPSYQRFFEQEGWTVAGLRGSDSEIGRCFLLMRKLLNRGNDGVLPVRHPSNTNATLQSASTESV